MNSKVLLITVLLIIGSNSVFSQKPNVIYIFTDDQSIRTLATYNASQEWVRTPNIDKLANEGVQFNYCYTGAKCVPSRGNALTGQLQFNFSKETPYWQEEFRRQGYYTGMVGKWHWTLPRHDKAWDWSAVWEHYLPENIVNYYWGQKLRINGDSLVELNGYSTDRYTDYAVEFIHERANNKNKPWFFWLCYGGVHAPYTPAERHLQMYQEESEVEIPCDVFGPRPDKPEYMHNLTMWGKDSLNQPIYRKRSLDSWVKQYNQAVQSIDEGVGRIRAALEETGQLDNTIIIFTSDNGFAWGQHGFRLKIAPYDANLLTPLIVYKPNSFPKGKVNCPVNGVDIIKTIHSLCNVTPDNKLDGNDFSEILMNNERDKYDDKPMIQIYLGLIYGGQNMLISELEKANETGNWEKFITHKTGIRAWMMMRKGQFKYIRYIYPDYIEELYDMKSDPKELTNLAVDGSYRHTLEQYRKETLELFKNKGAKFIDLLPKPKIVNYK